MLNAYLIHFQHLPASYQHTSGDIIVGKRNGNGKEGLPTPHPTLIGGVNPEVAMAGMLHIHGGKIDSYDNMSGHFKPNIKSMFVADNALIHCLNHYLRKREDIDHV